MARGDSKVISVNVGRNVLEGDYNLTTNTLNYVLVTDTFASIDANAASLGLSNLTQVTAGGSYTGPTALSNVTVTQSNAVTTIDYDDITLASNASNPNTARCLVIYNDSAAGDDVFKVTDLTTDGSTAVDLTQGLTFNINASGSITYTANA
jgi:hypothetical protein